MDSFFCDNGLQGSFDQPLECHFDILKGLEPNQIGK